MTPQERALLQDFLEQLTQVRGVKKDPEADALVKQAFARQPDAAYLLVQRTLLVEQALDQAKREIERLEAQVREPRGSAPSSSFLGDEADAWGRRGRREERSVTGAPLSSNRLPEGSAAPSRERPGLGGMMEGARTRGAGGSFLTNAAAAAAGVVGGAFLFRGIESLLAHREQEASGASSLADAPAAHDSEAVDSANEQFTDEGYDVADSDFDVGGGDDFA